MRILGIDPGTRFCGYALIQDKPLQLIKSGVWKFNQKLDVYERIMFLHNEMETFFRKNDVDALAIEKAFVGKNPQTSLKLGEARGVVLGVGFSRKVVVRQYEPVIVKKSVTGNHKSSKESVAFMVGKIFGKEKFERDDESDAIAIAYTLSVQYKVESLSETPKKIKPKSNKKKSSWSNYKVKK